MSRATPVALVSQRSYSPSKVTHVAQDFPPLVRDVDGNGSVAAISSVFLVDHGQLVGRRVLGASGLIRYVDRHLQAAATSGVPLFDRRHAW